MALITIGLIDKKLIIIAILVILRIIYIIINKEVPSEYLQKNISYISEDFGGVLTGIIMVLLFKPREKEEKEKEKKNKKEKEEEKQHKNKKSKKYILILFLLKSFSIICEVIFNSYIKEYELIINSINGLGIVLLSGITILLLKYKYYIHHTISMIIYFALGIIIDIILGNYSKISFKYIYIAFWYFIDKTFMMCYLNYMMDKIYYHYTEMILYYTSFGFFTKLCIFSGFAIYQYINNTNELINEAKIYFEENNIFTIIFLQFFYFFFHGGCFNTLVMLILFYFKPNHTIISNEFNDYFNTVIYGDNPNKLYTIIPFVLQILALIFYFEILELNFLQLNKNTTKNIQLREGKEDQERLLSEVSVIELENQYLVNENEMNNGNDSFASKK